MLDSRRVSPLIRKRPDSMTGTRNTMNSHSIFSKNRLRSGTPRSLSGLVVTALLVLGAAGWLLVFSVPAPLLAQNDGCYICQGKPFTYVKFEGKDNWDKRKKAEACGCKVGGTTSSCDAANYKILCEVK